MMKVSVRQILLVVPALVIIAIAAYAVIKPANRIPEDKKSARQEAILKELSAVLHQLDTLTILTIEGTITAKDLADSTRNMQTSFCYSRNGGMAYYKFGQQEMISLDDAYIVVAHDIKKVFLSPPREIVNPVKLSPDVEVAMLAQEGYEVNRRVGGDGIHISLANSIHPTCRAYEVTFDSTGWIKRSHMRVADEGNPLDSTRDKLISVNVRSFQPGIARKDLLSKDRYVTLSNSEVVPAQSLSRYELIKDR